MKSKTIAHDKLYRKLQREKICQNIHKKYLHKISALYIYIEKNYIQITNP